MGMLSRDFWDKEPACEMVAGKQKTGRKTWPGEIYRDMYLVASCDFASSGFAHIMRNCVHEPVNRKTVYSGVISNHECQLLDSVF